MSANHKPVEAEIMFTMRMPTSLVDELRKVAQENDRSLSAEARMALRAWLAQSEKAA